MKRKALYSYAVLLVVLFVSHAADYRFFHYAVPFYLVIVPLLLRGRINCIFSLNQILLGLAASAAVLVPYWLIFSPRGAAVALTPASLIYQFFAVSFAEEVFFRGFLQEVLGNTFKGVVVVSILFWAAHLPALFFRGDLYAPLTFFPSLVMGFLYKRTSNVLPSTLFHFFANVLFTGFMI